MHPRTTLTRPSTLRCRRIEQFGSHLEVLEKLVMVVILVPVYMIVNYSVLMKQLFLHGLVMVSVMIILGVCI